MGVRVALAAAALVVVGIVGQLLAFNLAEKEGDLEHQRHFNDSYKIFSLTLPHSISFCGEEVPMQKLDVRERLDRELLVNTYWQSNSVLAHKRAARWFPTIEAILEREGVPDDMKYIALIESGLSNVISPSGATGYWQFMKETGERFGLEVGNEVDERYHVQRSTEAACRYLKEAYTRFGSWTMAAASYNLGMGGLDRQIARQRRNNYYDLLLPEETGRYIFRALAMKEVVCDPERYGFHIRQKDLYAPFQVRSMTLTGPVEDLAELALRQGTDYKTLKLLNPWLRETYLTNKEGRTYELLLPAEDFDKTSAE
jgi:membrane-bound lytic murein transglycosylase D